MTLDLPKDTRAELGEDAPPETSVDDALWALLVGEARARVDSTGGRPEPEDRS
ncbi:MAG TPA: hypothetical protein VGK28_12515 [Candidatus Dormibacteraeota bacterium]|jgi:hypothetical protein